MLAEGRRRATLRTWGSLLPRYGNPFRWWLDASFTESYGVILVVAGLARAVRFFTDGEWSSGLLFVLFATVGVGVVVTLRERRKRKLRSSPRGEAGALEEGQRRAT
jgi:hypothetical protein